MLYVSLICICNWRLAADVVALHARLRAVAEPINSLASGSRRPLRRPGASVITMAPVRAYEPCAILLD
jgi:hypothetical protein